jgi:hypothetical protein
MMISYVTYNPYTAYFCEAPYNRRFVIDHAGAAPAGSVSVIRTNRVCTGANEITVRGPLPLPCATGALQVVPLVDTCTL